MQYAALYHTSDDRWLVLSEGRHIFGSFPNRFEAQQFLRSSPLIAAYIEGRRQEQQRIASICDHPTAKHNPDLVSDLVNGGQSTEECMKVLAFFYSCGNTVH